MQAATAIVFLPLLGAIIAGLFGGYVRDKGAQWITCSLLVTSAVLSGLVFYDVVILKQSFQMMLLPWISSGEFTASWGLRIDPLTAVMLVVVTWVSSVVHIYSVGYMSHDPHKPRFMAYLSLFTFCMLMLVTSDNFVQLFFGWEGVGLSSYLLIGFWYKKPEANAAAIKAFLVNRVGDFGFALGVFATFLLFGSVDFDTVFATVPEFANEHLEFMGYEVHALTLICLLLFVGAMGKSAQLGLHTWLPDAMEGPTPVSALIHAATMVTAGVFLVARCSPMFEYAPVALTVVTIVGAATALFAASVGLVQNDIKRVIAYSTCSQLGYMFFACGVSAYSAGIFHLMTHAFFKALLFLGAGSVIHAMSDEQDMRSMGGIWNKIPYTYAYMWIGTLALAGIGLGPVGFAGYFSKDMILESAFVADRTGAEFAFIMGVLAAFMTAFYSARLMFMTFHGTPRASDEVMSHIHESPPVMLLPLLLLAAGAVFAGFAGYHMLGMVDADLAFWSGSIVILDEHNILEEAHHVPWEVKYLPLMLAVIGIFLAWVLYVKKPAVPGQLASSFPVVYKFLLNKWYFDELYDFLFVRSAKKLGNYLWKGWDVRIIDGLGPNGSAWAVRTLAAISSRFQTGYLYHYAFAMLLGLVGLITWYVITGGV